MAIVNTIVIHNSNKRGDNGQQHSMNTKLKRTNGIFCHPYISIFMLLHTTRDTLNLLHKFTTLFGLTWQHRNRRVCISRTKIYFDTFGQCINVVNSFCVFLLPSLSLSLTHNLSLISFFIRFCAM